MKKILIYILLFFPLCVFAQHIVKFIVVDDAMYPATQIFIAGNFNNWNPSDKNYSLTKKENNTWQIILPTMLKGDYSFKLTQGSWETVEDSTNGVERNNRLVNIKSDTTFYFTTLRWRLPEIPRGHTISKNVQLISDSFFIPQLNRKRKISIYLPANYSTSKERYPVLYMQDGQNLFDEFTAAFGEWNVDETLDSIQKLTHKNCIVVAIDHGDKKRLNEYNPYFFKEFGKGEGEAYVSFLVKTLKPFIDKKYRTKSDVTNTAIAGSSMGGLISTYAILRHPSVIGSAGVFSPAYWIAPDLAKFVKKQIKKNTANKFWFYGGGKEGYTMMPDMEKMYAIISIKNVDTFIIKDAEGKHNEAAWRKWFSQFYIWWINKL